jgi:hypothetical protein
MRNKTISGRSCGIFLLAVGGLFGQPSSTGTLPQRLVVKENGPRSYRFTVDYHTAGSSGQINRRQRVAGEYVRGLPGGEVVWRNVTQAEARGSKADFGAAQKRDFMDGFRYINDLHQTFQPDFFKAFPPTAVYERNLVWDAGMIEHFGQGYFQHLRLNEPHHVISNAEVNMPDVGSFRNHDVVLEWVGHSRRNAQECAVILYKAFFNPVQIANEGMTMNARSDYWGEIWVSLKTKQIEYATIYESVAGEMKLAGQEVPSPVNIFRMGVFQPAGTSGSRNQR